ncbi:MAG: SLBB domain-containing protein [Verrucomicrobiales bacterium]
MRTILSILFSFLFLCVGSGAAQDAVPDVADETYVLRPNDVIRLDVYEEPDLTTIARILKTGHASFPLIGSVKVGGVSVMEASKTIRDLYARDYLVDPKLTLAVQEYATDFISVIGAVRNPGRIPVPQSGDLDLASAVATAGGLAAHADTESIQLVRASGSTSTYSMAQIENGGKLKLAAGDRIIVKQSDFVGKSVTIVGQVRKPGILGFPVDGRLNLVNAIAMCGGMTDLANTKKVAINRKGQVIELDYRKLSQQGDKRFYLQPDDVVTIPERLF